MCIGRGGLSNVLALGKCIIKLITKQESERVLFILSTLGPWLGSWQVALPGGPLSVRRAACELLRFVVLPSADHRYTAHAGPLTEQERHDARRPWEIHINEGWFRVVNASVSTTLGIDSIRTSVYSAALAMTTYRGVAQALTLLLCLAPEVSEEEGPLLGDDWPTAELLTLLQGQADAVAIDMVSNAGRIGPASRQLARLLLCIVQASVQLQALMGNGQSQRARQSVLATMDTIGGLLTSA